MGGARAALGLVALLLGACSDETFYGKCLPLDAPLAEVLPDPPDRLVPEPTDPIAFVYDPTVLRSSELHLSEGDLAFLDADKKYKAHIYQDDSSVSTRTKVGIGRRAVDSETVLTITMSKQGGAAVRIHPLDQ